MNIYIKKEYLVPLLNKMVSSSDFDTCESGILFFAN